MRATYSITALLLGVLALSAVITLTACRKDKCREIQCYNGGACVDGDCKCMNGYSGTRCEIAPVDACDGVTCSNDGTCVNGACECAYGYEGVNCETLWRTKFLATGATVVDSCSNPSHQYTLDIVPGQSRTEILLKNFESNWMGAHEVKAYMQSPNAFVIPGQTFQIGQLEYWGLGGTGVLNGDQLTITYVYSQQFEVSGGLYDSCTARIQL